MRTVQALACLECEMSLRLTSNTFSDLEAVSKSQISDMLRKVALREIEFLVLARASEEYVQTTLCETGFVVEHRDGNEESHRVAEAREQSDGSLMRLLTLDEAETIFLCYFTQAPFPNNVIWRKEELPDGQLVWGLAVIGIVIALIVGFVWWLAL